MLNKEMKVNFTEQHISIHEKENQRDLANGKWKKRENNKIINL
jgi:hypothetical protein